jgi:hypothetical protein
MNHNEFIRTCLAWGFTLLVVCLILFLYLPFPLGGDTAMFVYAAREMSEGARLYVDFWDMKQPGVYWFYQVGGEFFGFDSIGARAMEIVWMLALSVLLVYTLRPLLVVAGVAYLAPVVCLGLAYAQGYMYSGQLELLISLPIVGVIACLTREPETERGRYVAYGLAGALTVVVAIFKLMLVVVPAGVILVKLVALYRQKQGIKALWPDVLALTLGGICCLAAVSIYLASTGSLGGAFWVSFIYPPLAIEAYPHRPLWQLSAGAIAFLEIVWPLMPFVLLAAVRLARGPLATIFWMLVAWLVFGVAAVSAQALSRWVYHFGMFFVPIGILATLGIDVLAQFVLRFDRRSIRLVASALVLSAVLVGVGYPWVQTLNRFWLSGAPPWSNLAAFQDEIDPKLKELRKSAAFLDEPGALPGRIGLLGDTRVVFVSNRRPTLEPNGWTLYLPEQITAAAEALREAEPNYVYVSTYLSRNHGNRNSAIYDVLMEDYFVHSRDDIEGIWYERRRAR